LALTSLKDRASFTYSTKAPRGAARALVGGPPRVRRQGQPTVVTLEIASEQDRSRRQAPPADLLERHGATSEPTPIVTDEDLLATVDGHLTIRARSRIGHEAADFPDRSSPVLARWPLNVAHPMRSWRPTSASAITSMATPTTIPAGLPRLALHPESLLGEQRAWPSPQGGRFRPWRRGGRASGLRKG
jgi:hypothetical protein